MCAQQHERHILNFCSNTNRSCRCRNMAADSYCTHGHENAGAEITEFEDPYGDELRQHPFVFT